MAALYELANAIEVRVNDDRPTGPGWKWLETAYEAIIEAALWAREHDEDVYDAAYEQSFEVVPVYTYELWLTFVALSGWQEIEATAEAAAASPDVDTLPQYALQHIAARIGEYVVTNLDAIIESRKGDAA